MTQKPIIRFESVSKKFTYARHESHTLLETLIALFTRQQDEDDRSLWAVKDVSFEVMPGQSLGIIGRNGSGKSTVLKLAAGIIRPSSGRIYIGGRLSALLELGAGFHPDLTGRENIYLNGSILGLSKEEIERCFDDIVAFSELGDFIDMPVKHYSSGMYMRLGFSVAVHVDPDILIVDEILAVGDQSFQSKCLDRIDELQHKGTTIIIVSHNLETVRNMCSHLVWVEGGAVQASGPANQVIDQFLEGQEGWFRRGEDGEIIFQRWGSREISLTEVRFIGESGQEQDVFNMGEAVTIEMHYQADVPVEEPEFGLAIFRQDGIYVSGPDNQAGGLQLGTLHGRGVVRYQLPQLPLMPDRYRVTAAIYDTEGMLPYDHHDKAYAFRVVADDEQRRKGLVAFPGHWEQLSAEEQLEKPLLQPE